MNECSTDHVHDNTLTKIQMQNTRNSEGQFNKKKPSTPVGHAN